MNRKPVVAGQFYPGTKENLEEQIKEYLSLDSSTDKTQTKLAMVPHAGYMFSGHVAGETLSKANLNNTVLLLGPNHTGQGLPLALWPDGEWEIPGAQIKIDESLAQEILNTIPEIKKDYNAHNFEHSLEVILPFLWVINKKSQIVPISVSEPNFASLNKIGQDLAQIIKNWNTPVSIIVSSDMSHFISQEQAKAKDNMAIEAILDLNPEKLYQTVQNNNITMCGILPMTMGLSLVNELGASQAELIQYATSADVTGDFQQVVGYAGILIW